MTVSVNKLEDDKNKNGVSFESRLLQIRLT